MSPRALFIILSLLLAPSSHLLAAQGYGLPIITCDIMFHYAMGKTAYAKRGPKLKSMPYARYDESYIEYHGDSLPFHPNGLYMPNIQPEFLASVFFSMLPGRQHANERIEVEMKLFDNRKNSAQSVEEKVLFDPNTQYTIALSSTNPNDPLRMVSMTCMR